MTDTVHTFNDVPVATKRDMWAGIVSGQIAGLIMAVVVMLVFSLFLGTNLFYPVQVIGSMALGESALQGINVFAVLVGVLLHQLGPSLLWGALYGVSAALLKIKNNPNALLLGLSIGIVSMIGPYLLIPFLMKTLHGKDMWNENVPLFWDWAAHLVFGASLAVFPWVRKKIS